MQRIDLKSTILTAAAWAIFLNAWAAVGAAGPPDPDSSATPATILTRYVEATQNHEDALRGASIQVEINASVPKLKEQGKLRALRKMSKVGQITYQLLGFQGDNTVKSQVIARYLQAEQQGQGDESLAVTPANYKFKFKGRKQTESNQEVFTFQVSPRKKKVGLFKGEIWLDAKTYLPVVEKGRLVKNPSIFFKRVDFERDFAIRNGIAVPQHMTSTIDTRLIGKVNLSIDYSNFDPNGDTDEKPQPQSVASTGSTAE